MSFIHAYPGLVYVPLPRTISPSKPDFANYPDSKTDLAASYPLPLRWASNVLLSLLGVSDVVCAEYMLRGCFEREYERGFVRIGKRGERVEKRRVEGVEGRRRVGEHCDEVLGRGV